MPAAETTDRFTGFPEGATAFFRDLERHNDRDWFLAHKAEYEQTCRAPMQALARELDPLLGAARISRINRDTRFVRDGGPYRTYIAAGVGGYYIQLSARGLYVGTGLYKPDSATLARLRAAIDAERSGRELAAIVAVLKRGRYEVGTHDSVKSAPKGFRPDHPRIELLRMKDIFGGRLFEPGPWLSTRTALDRVRRTMTAVRPLKEWLARHVSPR